ncbi:MAG: PE-PPE domain-containing protein, partial [Gordonia sp. (in: high G+C Gram-positive bacteria)]
MNNSRSVVAGRRGLAVAAGCAVVGAFALPNAAGVARADYDCQAGAVVIVAGTGDVGAPSQVGVAQRYGAQGYKVIKPGYPTTLWPLGRYGFDDDVSQGTTSTLQQITDYQKNCKDKPVVIVGYSQGARVAGDVLNQIGTGQADADGNVVVTGPDGEKYTINRNQITGELYSDPRRDGPESGRGIELALSGIIPGLMMSGPRTGGFGDLQVTSYCEEGDPICDLPDLFHDPFGVIDGFVGYFTKHGYYPWRMWAPVDDATVWNCDPELSSTVDNHYDCVVAAPSAISGVRQGVVDQVRSALGLAPRTVVDFWGMLPNIDRIFPHANFSDLQQYLRPVMGLLPPLPKLGYGAYLPDVYIFTGILQGLATFDGQAIVGNLKALADSLGSVAMLPVNFTKYWAAQLKKVVAGKSAPAGVTTLAAALDGADRAVLFGA